jgi:predicted DNA-binding protein (MmcQ/YjbR family)
MEDRRNPDYVSPDSRRITMAKASQEKAEAALRAYALRFPEANEDFPWGERVIKVRGKIFVFFATGDGGLRVSVKLPISFEMALTLPFTAPTRYGLGRAKWITARFAADETPPVDLLQGWIAQSYRAVAPKALVKALDSQGANSTRSVRRPA